MDCTAEIEDTCTGKSREFIFEVTDADTDADTDTNTGTDTDGKLPYINNVIFRIVINLTICTMYSYIYKLYYKNVSEDLKNI